MAGLTDVVPRGRAGDHSEARLAKSGKEDTARIQGLELFENIRHEIVEEEGRRGAGPPASLAFYRASFAWTLGNRAMSVCGRNRAAM